MATPPQPMSYATQDGVAEGQPSGNQTPAFFLSNYRLGKTLGNGSFGKVCLFSTSYTTFYLARLPSVNRRSSFENLTQMESDSHSIDS